MFPLTNDRRRMVVTEIAARKPRTFRPVFYPHFGFEELAFDKLQAAAAAVPTGSVADLLLRAFQARLSDTAQAKTALTGRACSMLWIGAAAGSSPPG